MTEHVSGAGAGAENGAEKTRKPDERERSGGGKNTAERERERSGAGAGGRVSGSDEVNGLNRLLTIRSNLTID